MEFGTSSKGVNCGIHTPPCKDEDSTESSLVETAFNAITNYLNLNENASLTGSSVLFQMISCPIACNRISID